MIDYPPVHEILNPSLTAEQEIIKTFQELGKSKIENPEIFRISLETIADKSHFSLEIRQAAFEALRELAPKTEPGYFAYCEEIQIQKEIPSNIYGEFVHSMPISCVDVFVYNHETDCYLMLLRSNAPAKGVWWLPGGRIYKGESFFGAAARKTKMEGGIEAVPIAKLGNYSTYFPDSAWGENIATDTKNTIVLALAGGQKTELDRDHHGSKWVPMEEIPDDPYLRAAYMDAQAKLKELGF